MKRLYKSVFDLRVITMTKGYMIYELMIYDKGYHALLTRPRLTKVSKAHTRNSQIIILRVFVALVETD